MWAIAKHKDCYCHTCKKSFNHLGIARHRAFHRDKRENCKITYSSGNTYLHIFSDSTKTFESKDNYE
jgi:hypothetical protein